MYMYKSIIAIDMFILYINVHIQGMVIVRSCKFSKNITWAIMIIIYTY